MSTIHIVGIAAVPSATITTHPKDETDLRLSIRMARTLEGVKHKESRDLSNFTVIEFVTPDRLCYQMLTQHGNVPRARQLEILAEEMAVPA